MIYDKLCTHIVNQIHGFHRFKKIHRNVECWITSNGTLLTKILISFYLEMIFLCILTSCEKTIIEDDEALWVLLNHLSCVLFSRAPGAHRKPERKNKSTLFEKDIRDTRSTYLDIVSNVYYSREGTV